MFGSFTTVPPAPKGNKTPETPQSWMNKVSDTSDPRPPIDKPESQPASSPYATHVQQISRNVLNSDVEVVGSLHFSDDLLIDGRVNGDITSEGVLSVGENAEIRATINTKSVIIHGKVEGNVTVTDSVELKKTAELVGDIVAASLAIESGAIFIGQSTVGAPTISTTTSKPVAKVADPQPAKAPADTTKASDKQSTLGIDPE